MLASGTEVARATLHTRLDRAWLVEERRELEMYAARAQLAHARAAVEVRNGAGLGLDGTSPTGIPTPQAHAELADLGTAAAAFSKAYAAWRLARLARQRARAAVDRARRRR